MTTCEGVSHLDRRGCIAPESLAPRCGARPGPAAYIRGRPASDRDPIQAGSPPEHLGVACCTRQAPGRGAGQFRCNASISPRRSRRGGTRSHSGRGQRLCALRSDRPKPFSAIAPGLFQTPFWGPHDPRTLCTTWTPAWRWPAGRPLDQCHQKKGKSTIMLPQLIVSDGFVTFLLDLSPYRLSDKRSQLRCALVRVLHDRAE
jgi:hypothetical protein